MICYLRDFVFQIPGTFFNLSSPVYPGVKGFKSIFFEGTFDFFEIVEAVVVFVILVKKGGDNSIKGADSVCKDKRV